MGTSYELGTAFMGEGTEFLHCAPQNSGASLRRQTFVCVWCQWRNAAQPISPAELHQGPKPATLEGALLQPLGQWFSAFLKLRPFNTVPHAVVVSPNHKFSLLFQN